MLRGALTSYAEFVEKGILAKCGITGMKIAGNTREDRIENEVIYYGGKGQDPKRACTRATGVGCADLAALRTAGLSTGNVPPMWP